MIDFCSIGTILTKIGRDYPLIDQWLLPFKICRDSFNAGQHLNHLIRTPHPYYHTLGQINLLPRRDKTHKQNKKGLRAFHYRNTNVQRKLWELTQWQGVAVLEVRASNMALSLLAYVSCCYLTCVSCLLTCALSYHLACVDLACVDYVSLYVRVLITSLVWISIGLSSSAGIK